ncbi:MAG TPA: AraC family transcriptional regulator [Azonexus sp.]
MEEQSSIPVSLLPEGYVRVGSFTRFARLVRELGGRAEDILAPFKLDEGLLRNRDNALPAALRGELMAAAARQTGCEHLGLLLGKRSEAADLGLPGDLAMAAATVGEALDKLQRYFHFHSRNTMVSVGRDGDSASLGYLVVDGSFPGFQELQDGSLASGLNLMRQLIAPGWTPEAVSLIRRTPRQPEIYDRFFGAPCRFNAERTALIFPAATLDLPVAAHGGAVATGGSLPQAGDALLSDGDWLNLVRRTTQHMLMNDNCSQRTVAQALGVSARTMNRNIERSGSSYREVVDFCRYKASRTLIKETDMSLCNVARVLGYADHSSFCRAFKRWSGMSPSEWRQRKSGKGAEFSHLDP